MNTDIIVLFCFKNRLPNTVRIIVDNTYMWFICILIIIIVWFRTCWLYLLAVNVLCDFSFFDLLFIICCVEHKYYNNYL